MNLADYSKMPKGDTGEFLKWTKNGEVKVLRFLYTSNDGADIEVRRKYWDDEQKKYVYDTPDGKLTCVLSCVLYEEGQKPRRVRWERSAAFTEQICNSYWCKYPRIVDGVWEVTCTNPGTKDIKFSFFPVFGADFTTHPLPEGVSIKDGKIFMESANNDTASVKAATTDAVGSAPVTPASSATSTAQAPTGHKYWE